MHLDTMYLINNEAADDYFFLHAALRNGVCLKTCLISAIMTLVQMNVELITNDELRDHKSLLAQVGTTLPLSFI